MKILITGSDGFVGKNLTAELINNGHQVFGFDVDTPLEELEYYCSECEFVYHLAGVNRPKETSEFMTGNFGFTNQLLQELRTAKNNCPIMLSSSIQAELDNPYGQSKRAGEELLQNYSNETGALVYIYRFANLFGKWCRPNYNSVVATFCYNIARGLPIQVNNPETVLCLNYIDDVVFELIGLLDRTKLSKKEDFETLTISHHVSLGEIGDLLYAFKESREQLYLPEMTEGSFGKKLYSTYLSYLPENELSYFPKMNTDDRGSFTELFKSLDRGQVSVNIAKPGIEKGNHWHHTKNEKFVVVSGEGLIKFKQLHSTEVISYLVSGNQIEIVDIPPGYTHSITNVGTTDLVTVMWCNECFNKEKPDTYYLKVDEETKL